MNLGRAFAIGSVLLILAVIAGTGLAALPSADNSPCITPWISDANERLGDADVAVRLVPFGTTCRYGAREVTVFHGPSTLAYVAWLIVAAALIALGVRFRRAAAARGLPAAVVVLGLLGLLWHVVEFTAAAMGALIAGALVAYALDRALAAGKRARSHSGLVALTLPPAVVAAWIPLGFTEVYVLAAVAALAAAAGVSVAVERLFRIGVPPELVAAD